MRAAEYTPPIWMSIASIGDNAGDNRSNGSVEAVQGMGVGSPRSPLLTRVFDKSVTPESFSNFRQLNPIFDLNFRTIPVPPGEACGRDAGPRNLGRLHGVEGL